MAPTPDQEDSSNLSDFLYSFAVHRNRLNFLSMFIATTPFCSFSKCYDLDLKCLPEDQVLKACLVLNGGDFRKCWNREGSSCICGLIYSWIHNLKRLLRGGRHCRRWDLVEGSVGPCNMHLETIPPPPPPLLLPSFFFIFLPPSWPPGVGQLCFTGSSTPWYTASPQTWKRWIQLVTD